MLTGDREIDLKHLEFIRFAIMKLEKLDRNGNKMFNQAMAVLQMIGVRQNKIAYHVGIDQSTISFWRKEGVAHCKIISRAEVNTKLLEFLKIHEASVSKKTELKQLNPAT